MFTVQKVQQAWFDGGTKQGLKKSERLFQKRKTCQVSQQKASSFEIAQNKTLNVNIYT